MKPRQSKTIATALTFAFCAGIALASGVSDADATTRWKLAWGYPSTSPYGYAGKRIPEQVELLSGGDFKIKAYEPGALVPMMQIFDSVSEGSLDAGWAGLGFWPGKESSFALFNAYPFGPAAVEYIAWFKHGGGNDLADEILAKHNVKALLCGLHSPEGSGWFRKEVKSLDDLKGLKMRIAGLGGKTLEKFGVNSQILAGGDIYPALERGVIDAAEYSMPLVDLNAHLYEIAKHYYFPGWHQPYTTTHLLMHKPKWEALSPRNQRLLETVCDTETLRLLSMAEAGNADAIETMRDQHHVNIHRWPDDTLENLNGAWMEVMEEEKAKNAFFAKVWDSLQTFRTKYAVWHRLSMP